MSEFKAGTKVIVVDVEDSYENYYNGDVGVIIGDPDDKHTGSEVEFENGEVHYLYRSEFEEWKGDNSEENIVSVNVSIPPLFQVGDRVKFKRSSLETGMIEAMENDIFVVRHVAGSQIYLEEIYPHYHANHFEHVKEEIMEEQKIENQAIDWQVGQEVWDMSWGQGVVIDLGLCENYPINVKFPHGKESYTKDAKSYIPHKNRSLFFSEPKIEAELFPPKKPFVPTFKKGDVVVCRELGSSYSKVGIVDYEDHDSVALEDEDAAMYKHAFEFNRIGEEIKFN